MCRHKARKNLILLVLFHSQSRLFRITRQLFSVADRRMLMEARISHFRLACVLILILRCASTEKSPGIVHTKAHNRKSLAMNTYTKMWEGVGRVLSLSSGRFRRAAMGSALTHAQSTLTKHDLELSYNEHLHKNGG